eukprot:7444791-Pyramimonas_sp.AAC.1
MSCIAVLYLNFAASHSNDDLAPLGVVSYDWGWAIPASPIVLRGCGAMVNNQISFIVVMLTGESSLSA